jgi:glutaminase
VPNVITPKGFRVPEFVKYTGTQYPVTHLKAYYNKMVEVVYNKKLFIHFFQDSLSDTTLAWYMRLDNTKVKKWKDLVDAFIRQCKLNMDVGSIRSNLQAMEKDNKESIREYAQR